MVYKKCFQIFLLVFAFFPNSYGSDNENLSTTATKKNICIYNGDGFFPDALIHTEHSMRALADPQYYDVKMIGPEEIIAGKWVDTTALLVMTAGAEAKYCKSLNSAGNNQIKSFVCDKGGSCVFICGSTYYVGTQMEFAKGTRFEVAGPRELGFFPGLTQGPTLAEYDYKTYAGARAAKVCWQLPHPFGRNKKFTAFYNGGPHFVDAASLPNVTVLATYEDDPKKRASIIECTVGKGKAIASSIHFEVDPFLRDPNDRLFNPAINRYFANIQKITPALEGGDEGRLQLAHHLLHRLGIKTRVSHIRAKL